MRGFVADKTTIYWARIWALAVYGVAAMISHAPGLVAQTTTATVAGVITDVTGAVIPAAKVTVTNTATQVGRAVVTDEGGRFLVPQLPPGPYEVAATAPGLSTSVQGGTHARGRTGSQPDVEAYAWSGLRSGHRYSRSLSSEHDHELGRGSGE